MGKKIFITNLSLPQYVGVRKCTIPDSYGFMRKEFRIDYSGSCDIGTQRVEMFPLLSELKDRPKSIMVSKIEKGTNQNQYTCFALEHYINDINEKTMRLLVVYYSLQRQIKNFDTQIHNVLNICDKKVPAVDLDDHTHELLSRVELFFYLLQSTLDLYAKLASVFNKNAPKKFGAQLYVSFEKKKMWDKEYQRFLSTQKELKNWLNKYRNELAHEFSLKMRFKKINRCWRTVISSNYYSTEGLVIPDALEILWAKYLKFCDFFDKHFFQKQSKLEVFADNNHIS